MAQGLIAAARQFFLRAANLKSASGALHLAETYDPLELAKVPTAGLTPDYAEAKKWYELAQKLGSREAGARLSRLNSK